MDEQQFWALIDLFDWSKQGQDDLAVMRPAIDKLAECPVDELKEFQELLARKLYALDTVQHADHATNSADGFLYDRCYVVARGRAFYENILHDPAQMRPFWLEFAFDGTSLLYLVDEAAEHKGIIDFSLYNFTQVSYETGSNKDGWKDDISLGN